MAFGHSVGRRGLCRAVFLAAVLLPACTEQPLPPEMIWVWRGAAAIDFVDPSRTGVAAWMATVLLDEDGLKAQHRMQPLRVVDGTYLVMTVRIESSRERPPRLDQALLEELSGFLLQLLEDSGWQELQLDFDVLESERAFYQDLLRRLKADLARQKPPRRLSMTALLSWCWEPGFLDAPDRG